MSGSPLDAIRTRLTERRITQIVVIDDAFDVPTRDSLDPVVVEQFWTDIKDQDDAVKELTAIGLKCEEPFDISQEQTATLFSRVPSLKAAREACGQLFSDVLGKQREVERFTKPLEEELKLKVVSLGSGEEFSETSARLIFLDYYLGPERSDEAIQAAVERAESIYKAYPEDGEKPLIILMSSFEDVAQHKEEFRKRSRLIGGMFDFVPKKELANRDRLILKIGSWAMGLADGYKIQHFVEAIDRSARAATDQFVDGVKALTLEDYGHIQRLSLQEDGHPLGDYMLWLFGAFFGDLLFHKQPDVRKHQNTLDALWVEQAPPCQQPPSVKLAEMYRAALFDPSVEDLGPHPLGAMTPDAPHMRLGDLFLKDTSNEVLLVISPECDLAFSPRGKRTCDPDQSVLLIPGQLQPIHEPLPKGSDLRTELFEHEGQAYRIIWNKKQVRSERLGKIGNCLRTFRYERRARFRLPYALMIQQAFAADLTRVGMPVAPPIYRPVIVQAYIEGNDGKSVELHGKEDKAAFLALGRTGTHLVLTVDYVLLLQSKMEDIAKGFDDRKAKLGAAASGNDGSKLTQRARELRQLKEDFSVWLDLLRPALLKDDGKRTTLNAKLLCVAPPGPVSDVYDAKGPAITLVVLEHTSEEQSG